MSARAARMPLAGWGNFPVEECRVYRPERRADLVSLVVEGAEDRWIPRGLGRAYGDASLNADAGVLLGERLGRILDFDPATGLLWCESALSLAASIVGNNVTSGSSPSQ